MTTPQTLGDPLDLPLPEAWPEPRPRCQTCALLAVKRQQAQGAGDYSAVSDANVEIRRHKYPHRRRP